MFGFGLLEILFILALALILIGPEQMPEVARSLAKLLNELKRVSQDLTHSITEVKEAPREYLNKVITEEKPKPEPEKSKT